MSASPRIPMISALAAALLLALALSSAVPRADAVLWHNPNAGNCWVRTVPSAANRWIPVHRKTIANAMLRDQGASDSQLAWDIYTSVQLPSSDFWSSRIWETDGNYGATNWVGLTSPNAACESTSTQIQYNHYYLPYGNYARYRNVSCHELGHALGLDHNPSTSSCLYASASSVMVPLQGDFDEVSWWYSAVYP